MRILSWLLKNWQVTLLLLALTGGIGYVTALTHQRNAARRERDAVADTLINARAAADTLRQLNDTLHEQLAFQAERVTSLVADSQRTGRVLATVSVKAQQYQRKITQLTEQLGDTTVTRDTITAGPVTAAATVRFVPPFATWTWDVRQASYDITLGLSCKLGPAGRLAPVAELSGPAWFRPSVMHVVTATTVCNVPTSPGAARTVKVIVVTAGGVLLIEHVILPLIRETLFRNR